MLGSYRPYNPLYDRESPELVLSSQRMSIVLLANSKSVLEVVFLRSKSFITTARKKKLKLPLLGELSLYNLLILIRTYSNVLITNCELVDVLFVTFVLGVMACFFFMLFLVFFHVDQNEENADGRRDRIP